MSRIPALLSPARRQGFAAVAGLALGQAAAAGLAAVAVRDVFAGWGDPMLAPHGAALLVAAGALIALCRWGERAAGERLGLSYAADLRREAFAHVARMPAQAVARRRAGGLALRFVGDLAAFRGWAGRGATRLVSAAVALPGAGLALALVSPAAALGAAPGLALGAGAMLAAGAPLGRLHRSLRRRRARLAADMSERLALAPELRLAGRMTQELARLDRLTAQLERSALNLARRTALLRAAPDVAGALAGAGAMLACWRAGAPGAELAGGLAAVAIMTAQLRDLSGVWTRRRAYTAARARLEALLAAPRMPHGGARTRLRSGPPELRFEGVDAGPLRGFAARIAAAETIALCGPTGSGKSTLLRLAVGLEAPAAGRVRLGGLAPGRLAPADRTRALLYLSDRPLILSGSLRRAVAMGLPRRPDDAELQAAIARVGLGAALDRLGGLDGAVAEGGRDLSAGERARIALARLALNPTALALLDQPEAGLDEAGRAILVALLTERPGGAVVATADAALQAALDRRIALTTAA